MPPPTQRNEPRTRRPRARAAIARVGQGRRRRTADATPRSVMPSHGRCVNLHPARTCPGRPLRDAPRRPPTRPPTHARAPTAPTASSLGSAAALRCAAARRWGRLIARADSARSAEAGRPTGRARDRVLAAGTHSRVLAGTHGYPRAAAATTCDQRALRTAPRRLPSAALRRNGQQCCGVRACVRTTRAAASRTASRPRRAPAVYVCACECACGCVWVSDGGRKFLLGSSA